MAEKAVKAVKAAKAATMVLVAIMGPMFLITSWLLAVDRGRCN